VRIRLVQTRLNSFSGLLFLASTFPALAAGPVIGLVVAEGKLRVDDATVTGNGNLSEGSKVKTAKGFARVQLNGGIRAAVGPETEARVHTAHLELSRGLGVVASPAYAVRAGAYTIQAAAGAQSTVYRKGETVEVGAAEGEVVVRNGAGMTIARVLPGQPLRLEPGTPGQSSMTGILRRERSRFRLEDEVTRLDVELRGAGLDQHAGQRVSISGGATAQGDSQLIQVARLVVEAEQQSPGAAKPTTGAAKPGAQPDSERRRTGGAVPGGSSGGSGGGMSSGARIGIIAAVGGGAAAGIILATSSSSRSPGSISR
jgi:hypothetical protein